VDSFPHYLDKKNGELKIKKTNQVLHDVDGFDEVYIDFSRLANPMPNPSMFILLRDWLNTNVGQSDLQEAYDSIKRYNAQSYWAQTIVKYVNQPFNREGFRSIPFRSDSTTVKKVFLVGDSYVYGFNARPFHASFADNLLAKGYMVYSAGIAGTDPAQYAAIAKRYIPVINPDVVVMCFYEGNDYMPYDRTPQPNKPHEYISNAGFFQSAPYGKFMIFENCYRYYTSLVVIPDRDEFFLNAQMSKTVLTSLVWGILLKLNLVSHPAVATSEKKLQKMYSAQKAEYTSRHIRAFEEACKQSKVQSIYVLIPQRDGALNKKSEYVTPDLRRANQVFGNITYHVPKGLKRKVHYGTLDDHFNNHGNKYFSQFLDTLILRY
jgi:hypothetical protein